MYGPSTVQLHDSKAMKAMKATRTATAATLVGAWSAIAASGTVAADDAAVTEERGPGLAFVYTLAKRNTEVSVFAPMKAASEGDGTTHLQLSFRTTRSDGSVVLGSGQASVTELAGGARAEIVHLPWGWFVVPAGGNAFLMATKGVSRTGEATFELFLGGQSTHPAPVGTLTAEGLPAMTEQLIGVVAGIFLEDGGEGESECKPTLADCMEAAIISCAHNGINTFSWSCENPPNASCSFSCHAPVPE